MKSDICIILIVLLFIPVFIIILRIMALIFSKVPLSSLNLKSTTLLSIVYCIVYILGIFYLDITRSEPVIDRFLIPLMPFILLCIADIGALLPIKSKFASKSYMVIGISILSVFIFGQTHYFLDNYKNSFGRISSVYEQIDSSVKLLSSDQIYKNLFAKEITEKTPLLSNRSHLMYAIIKRPVIGLPGNEYTKREWTFDETKKVIDKFNVQYIAYFRCEEKYCFPLAENQSFYEKIVKGNYPDWLEILFNDNNFFLFKVI